MSFTTISLQKSYIQADIILDTIPVISTLTNASIIFTKLFFQKNLSKSINNKNILANHIKNKSYVRCILGLLPVFGNVIIIIYSLVKPKSPIEIYKPKAKSGDPSAMFELALEYAQDHQYEKARSWTVKSAELKNVSAVLFLANAYEMGVFFGQNIPVDMSKAIELYKSIDSNGYAQYKLGVIRYLNGNDAFRLFLMSINNGVPNTLQFVISELQKVILSNKYKGICNLLALLLQKCDPNALNQHIHYIIELTDKLPSFELKSELLICLGHYYINSYNSMCMEPSKFNTKDILAACKKGLNYYFSSAAIGNLNGLVFLIEAAKERNEEAVKLIRSISTHNTPQLIKIFKKDHFDLRESQILCDLSDLGNREALGIIKHLSDKKYKFAQLKYLSLVLEGKYDSLTSKSDALEGLFALITPHFYMPALSYLLKISHKFKVEDAALYEHIHKKIEDIYPSISRELLFNAHYVIRSISVEAVQILNKLAECGLRSAGEELLLLAVQGNSNARTIFHENPALHLQYISCLKAIVKDLPEESFNYIVSILHLRNSKSRTQPIFIAIINELLNHFVSRQEENIACMIEKFRNNGDLNIIQGYYFWIMGTISDKTEQALQCYYLSALTGNFEGFLALIDHAKNKANRAEELILRLYNKNPSGLFNNLCRLEDSNYIKKLVLQDLYSIGGQGMLEIIQKIAAEGSSIAQLLIAQNHFEKSEDAHTKAKAAYNIYIIAKNDYTLHGFKYLVEAAIKGSMDRSTNSIDRFIQKLIHRLFYQTRLGTFIRTLPVQHTVNLESVLLGLEQLGFPKIQKYLKNLKEFTRGYIYRNN